MSVRVIPERIYTVLCCGGRLVAVTVCYRVTLWRHWLLPGVARRVAWQLPWKVTHGDWQWPWLE